jgi:short-subunit dehydrogenase
MQPNSNSNFKHIVITGASSGIGEALALHYAQTGVHLSLTGQNPERLEAVAKICRERGSQISSIVLSVTDRAAMEAWLYQIDNAEPIDLLIANAGISAGMGAAKGIEKADQVRKLFDVNVMGVLNSIDPVLPRMMERGHGHIAIMSSLAGFRGWPGAPAYSASKACVRTYGEGLRGALTGSGVKIHVICPGFVKSRMTDVNEFPMPFIMSADRAAQIIAIGIARNKGRIAFPAPVHFFMWLLSVMPDSFAGRLLQSMPAKREAAEI